MTPVPPQHDPESTAAWSLHDAEHEADGPAGNRQEPGGGESPGWSSPESFDPPPAAGPIVPDHWFADAPHHAGAGATAQFSPMAGPVQNGYGPQNGFGPQQDDFGPQQNGFGPQQDGFGPPLGGFGAPQNGPGPVMAEPWAAQQYPAPYAQQDHWADGSAGNATAMMSVPAGPGYAQAEYLPPQGQGYPPGGSYDGHGQPPGPGPSGRSNRPLILVVAGLVAVAVLAVGYVTLSGGSGSAAGPSSPVAEKSSKGTQSGAGGHDEATALNAILDASLRSRSQLNGAVSEAGKCNGLDTAISTMQQVASDRQQQIDQTNTLKLDKLDKGDQLRGALVKAINASLSVDKAYLSWAMASKGCHGRTKPNADVRHGQQLSGEATNAKRDFARLWDPVAEKEGFNKRGTYF